jgi:two-component system chemotaxis sensor kinase CheA
MSGQETELDRTVIEEIGDPLVHLIRNSIDHGIEAESERARAGKDLSGTIWLSSFNEGNKVFIEVRDDGKGIDAEKIVAKAIGRGLITEEDATAMSHSQKLDLIFAPGLSTSETITDISGRGVGMDVVRTKVESLSGTVHIDSQSGEGTRVRIELPLTLAIVQALLVDIGGEEYAIPLASIDETLRIEQDQVQMIDKRPVCVLRGDILPLINLRDMLDFPEDEIERAKPEFVVVARVGGQRAGLQVDSLIGQQEIVIKNLGELLLSVKYLSGATILGDGTVALILDAAQIIN